MRFTKKKNETPSWNQTNWSITKDSIYFLDSQGLNYSLGQEVSSYQLNGDTLILIFPENERRYKATKLKGKIFRKYKLIKADSSHFVITQFK